MYIEICRPIRDQSEELFEIARTVHFFWWVEVNIRQLNLVVVSGPKFTVFPSSNVGGFVVDYFFSDF